MILGKRCPGFCPVRMLGAAESGEGDTMRALTWHVESGDKPSLLDR